MSYKKTKKQGQNKITPEQSGCNQLKKWKIMCKDKNSEFLRGWNEIGRIKCDNKKTEIWALTQEWTKTNSWL